jgi:hypothetical protein
MLAPLLAFTVGYLAILVTHNVGVTTIERDSIVVAFIAAHVVGYLIAGRRELLLASEVALWSENARARAELTHALDEVRTLEGMLPICSFCHRIRDEHDEWQKLERDVVERSEAQFSHGLCPECELREYPGLGSILGTVVARDSLTSRKGRESDAIRRHELGDLGHQRVKGERLFKEREARSFRHLA